MITYTTADTDTDLEGILKLQKANLARDLPPEEIRSQGFVTVDHTLAQLRKLNDAEKHIVAKDNAQVVAYLLAMTKECRQDIPILFPMFEIFDSIRYKNRKVSECNYLVVGQVCVDKQYRGQGILDKAYAAYRDHFKSKYDFAITEIAATNTRSRSAHQRIGFQEVHSYTSPDGMEWIVVIWGWDN
jgi:predicted GNAT superfamily acetyltransferase